MKKRKIATLFKEMCCSACRADFDEKSVTIMRDEDDLIVFRLACQNCGKSFGVAFLGLSDFELKNYKDDDEALQVQDGPPPISADEVIDAHEFIQKLDEGWHKFISDMTKEE